MPFCKNCGNKVSDTSKFCGSCGEIINHVIKEEKTESSKFAEIQPINAEDVTPEPSLWELIRYKGDDIEFDKYGMAVAELDGKWGVVNSKFEWVLKPEFEKLGDWQTGRYFDEKDYLVARNDNKWGFINRRGEWIVQPLFKILGEYDKEDYCQALFDNKFGWIDRNGNWLIEPIFDFFDGDDWRIDFDKYDYGRVYFEGKFGFIDRKGNWKVPPKFDLLEKYDDNNYSSAKFESKYGFLDRLGRWKIQPEFDLLGRFDELNYCHAKSESKYGFIDRYGNWIIEPIFDAVGYFDKHGYANAVKEYDSGFINREGVLHIHPVIEKNFINSEHDLYYFDLGSREGEDKIVSNTFDILLNSFDYNDKFLFNASYLKNDPQDKLSLNDYIKSPFSTLRNLTSSSFATYCGFGIKKSCEFLVFYRETNRASTFAIFKQDNSIFLLINGMSGGKVFRLFNIEYVFFDNMDSGSNIEFESFLMSRRQKNMEFIENNIRPQFSTYSRLFRKKIIKDLECLLFFTDIEIISKGWNEISKSQLNPNDVAGIR